MHIYFDMVLVLPWNHYLYFRSAFYSYYFCSVLFRRFRTVYLPRHMYVYMHHMQIGAI